MKERPILFSAPMVSALLAGTKTQTRRLVRICNTPISEADYEALKRQRGIPTNARNVRMCGSYLKCDAPKGSWTVSSRVESPYGQSGDRLWVRETFALAPLCADPDLDDQDDWSPVYRADGDDRWVADNGDECKPPWKPSIFMPRWASRITLEVVDVRCERLTAISEADAKAEGVAPAMTTRKVYPSKHAADVQHANYRDGFRALWDDINSERAPWASDPWCWVVHFKRIAQQTREAAA